jgi:hypothetical protein
MRMKASGLSLSLFLALIIGAALSGAPLNAQVRPMKIKVTAEQANLREKPDIGSSIVQQIPEGTVLEADRKDGEWYFVRYTLEDGGVIGGFIHESLVEVVETGAPVPETRAAEKEPPAKARVRKPIRIGRIKAPELRTGSFPLEFSFSAGAGYIAPRDLNAGTRGYAGWTGASVGVPASGSPDVLHFAYVFGFDLTYRASAKLAFGLGADYIHGSNRGQLEYPDPLLTETLTTWPAARGIPVKLVVRYYPVAGLYVRAAVGVYAVKTSYLYRRDQPDADTWQQLKGEATGSGVGGEAACGGEWPIGTRTTFFAEAGLRMASFDRLTGTNVATDSTGGDTTEPGALTFFHRAGADEGTYAFYLVSGSVPAGAVDARRAVVNLSGLALRAGVRYRF